jgi:hypothetical protein
VEERMTHVNHDVQPGSLNGSDLALPRDSREQGDDERLSPDENEPSIGRARWSR